MFEQLCNHLPESLLRIRPAAAWLIAGAALLIAFVGARFSRSMLTLALVAGGTYIGLHLPAWMGWNIDPMGPAFASAIIMGLAGYLLGTLWEALLLGTLLAAGAGTAVWVSMANGASWKSPEIDWSATAVEIIVKVWQSLPVAVNRALPLGLIIGFGIGVLGVSLWPRVGRVVLYSLGGLTVSVICSAIAIKNSQPQWIENLPVDASIQLAVLLGVFFVAVVVQWFMMPKPAKPKRKRDDEEEPPVAEKPAVPAPKNKDTSHNKSAHADQTATTASLNPIPMPQK